MNKLKTQSIVESYRKSLWDVIELVSTLSNEVDRQYAVNQTGLSEWFVRWCLMVSKVGIHKNLNPNYVYELYTLDEKSIKTFIKALTVNKYKTLKELRTAIRKHSSMFDNSINENGYTLKRQLNNRQIYLNKRNENETYVE